MNERADHNNAAKLLIEASVSGLLLGAWLWVVVALGAHATAADPTSSPTSENLPMDGGVACRAPATPAADGSVGCAREVRHLVGTSREPGAGLTERSPGGES